MDEEAPACTCFPDDEITPDIGPIYTHLGFASCLEELIALMQY
jgi:hypothetical protein